MCRFPEWGCKQEARYRRKKRLWAEIDPQETGRGVAPETGIEPTAGGVSGTRNLPAREAPAQLVRREKNDLALRTVAKAQRLKISV